MLRLLQCLLFLSSDILRSYRGSNCTLIYESVLDYEVDGYETEGPAFTFPSMNQHCAMLFLSLLNEPQYGIDDVLLCDILDVGLIPIESEKAHALDGGIVIDMLPSTVYYMGNLVEGKPLNVLVRSTGT